MNWKLLKTAGYGDIVSPLCYAIRNDLSVDFHMDYGESYKYEQDPETITERILYICDYLNENYHVDVSFHYNSNLPYKHDVYDIKPIQKREESHNMLPKFRTHVEKPVDNIVFCTSKTNSDQLPESRKWKDPLSESDWQMLINYYEPILVDYTTPIDTLFKTIEDCDLFVGYHGSCAWIARLLQKPMLLFSRDHAFTTWAFPWCETYPKARYFSNADKVRDTSIMLYERFYENFYRS